MTNSPTSLSPTASPTSTPTTAAPTSAPTTAAPTFTQILIFQAAEVCGGGTYPGDEVNPCQAGFTGNPIPEDSPANYPRTCYNASAEFSSVNSTGLLALRCYSPSLDVGISICSANNMFTYDEAVAECANATTYNTTDWRLGAPATVSPRGSDVIGITVDVIGIAVAVVGITVDVIGITAAIAVSIRRNPNVSQLRWGPGKIDNKSARVAVIPTALVRSRPTDCNDPRIGMSECLLSRFNARSRVFEWVVPRLGLTWRR
eukprot:260437-Prorocentrum_minimum.AAC.6